MQCSCTRLDAVRRFGAVSICGCVARLATARALQRLGDAQHSLELRVHHNAKPRFLPATGSGNFGYCFGAVGAGVAGDCVAGGGR